MPSRPVTRVPPTAPNLVSRPSRVACTALTEQFSGLGDGHQLLGAAVAGQAQEEVIADEVKKGVVAGEIAGAPDRVAVAACSLLRNEFDARAQVARDGSERLHILRRGDNSYFLNSRASDLGQQDGEDALLLAITINEVLKGEAALPSTGDGDNCFAEHHKVSIVLQAV